MTTSEFPGAAVDVGPLLADALRRSSHEGARIVALHWLQKLVAARNQWRSALDDTAMADDPSARIRRTADILHDARVALRRLRATLREHRLTLALDEGPRIRRALRRLGRATNDVRDLDVHRAWLEAECGSLSDAAQREADVMLEEFLRAIVKGHATVTRTFERYLDPHADRLARRLSQYSLPQTVGFAGPPVTFARHLAARVDRGSAHLQRDLRLVSDVGSQRVLHRIRIRLKRQRALLSPFTRDDPAISAWYTRATEGQDRLGAMRDASLLATRAHREGHDTLTHALREVALAHYEAFSAQWSVDAASAMRLKDAAVQALRDVDHRSATAVPVMPTFSGGIGLPAGHGLPMEIERKFLLHGLPPQAAMVPFVRIEQGWLPGTMLRERLRRSIAPDGDERLTRTIKLGPPGERIEVEEPTVPELFGALWPLTVQARIRKRRHIVRDGALRWEVDVFLDRDLVLAEVELENVAQSVVIPSWLNSFIVREVTHEPAYLNSVMAQPDPASRDRGAF